MHVPRYSQSLLAAILGTPIPLFFRETLSPYAADHWSRVPDEVLNPFAGPYRAMIKLASQAIQERYDHSRNAMSLKLIIDGDRGTSVSA
jgi:hypothetical protein